MASKTATPHQQQFYLNQRLQAEQGVKQGDENSLALDRKIQSKLGGSAPSFPTDPEEVNKQILATVAASIGPDLLIAKGLEKGLDLLRGAKVGETVIKLGQFYSKGKEGEAIKDVSESRAISTASKARKALSGGKPSKAKDVEEASGSSRKAVSKPAPGRSRHDPGKNELASRTGTLERRKHAAAKARNVNPNKIDATSPKAKRKKS